MYRQNRPLAAALLLVILGLTGCTAPDGAPMQAGPTSSTLPIPIPNQTVAGPVKGVRVVNHAFGSSKDLLGTAIADLKTLGFWNELTKDLYVLKVSSRNGRARVPEDGHLADAFLTAQIDKRGSGALCDLMFFPVAMSDDLARYQQYYEQGLFADPPPSEREFWASILAHELAHCLGHGKGEPVAEAWEKKVLAAARGNLE